MANHAQIPTKTIAPMSADEFKAALDTLSIGQTYAGRFFFPKLDPKTGPRKVRLWVSGADEVPDAVALVLRLAIAHGVTLDRLCEIAEGADTKIKA